MKILAMGRLGDGVTLADLTPYQHAELRQAWQLYRDGVIRDQYTRLDGGGVVLMLEAPDVEQARAAIDSLPMVAAGVLAFDVMPLGPFLHYEALFVPQAEAAASGRRAE